MVQDTIELAYKGSKYCLNDILVDKFCPSDLIEPGTAPLLLEQQHNAVHFSTSAEEKLRQSPELQVGNHSVPCINSMVHMAPRLKVQSSP